MTGAPIKARDIRKCDICERGLMADRAFTFFRVTFERMAVDVPAVKGIVGMAHILGSEQLAAVMAPSDEVAVPIGPRGQMIVCDMCAMAHREPLFQLAEQAAQAAYVRRGRST